METLAQRYGAVANFVAVCVNGLVAYPPAWHPEADLRGEGWPRHMAAELAERVGMRTPVHAYVDVTDKGENLVGKLGLQTVPTHVLVDSSGKLVSVLARKQFPNGQAVEALVATSCERDGAGKEAGKEGGSSSTASSSTACASMCIPCTPRASKGDAGKAL